MTNKMSFSQAFMLMSEGLQVRPDEVRTAFLEKRHKDAKAYGFDSAPAGRLSMRRAVTVWKHFNSFEDNYPSYIIKFANNYYEISKIRTIFHGEEGTREMYKILLQKAKPPSLFYPNRPPKPGRVKHSQMMQ